MEMHDDLFQIGHGAVLVPDEELPLVRGLALLRVVAGVVPDVLLDGAPVGQLDHDVGGELLRRGRGRGGRVAVAMLQHIHYLHQRQVTRIMLRRKRQQLTLFLLMSGP